MAKKPGWLYKDGLSREELLYTGFPMIIATTNSALHYTLASFTPEPYNNPFWCHLSCIIINSIISYQSLPEYCGWCIDCE